MSRPRNEPFGVHVAIAERGLRLGPAARVRRLDVVAGVHRPHPASPAAGHGFNHHRRAVAERIEERGRRLQIGRPRRPGQHRHVATFGHLPRPSLVTKQRQCFDPRTDERQAGLLAPPGELRILTQEPVAGMHRVAPGLLGGLNQLGDIEIGRYAAPFQRARLVRLTHMQRGRIVLREHGNGANAEFRRGAHDPNGDLAPIGNQQVRHAHIPMTCIQTGRGFAAIIAAQWVERAKGRLVCNSLKFTS